MPAKLDAEQRRVARRIRQIGRQRGASPMELEAAIETGLVESGLRNLRGGDRDSQGWRQERKSLYANPRNLDASINRFFSETKSARQRKHFVRSGDLAAAVQRPAAQYRGRYEQRDKDAEAVLREVGAGGDSDAAGKDGYRFVNKTRTEKTFDTKGYEKAQRGQALAQFLERRKGPRGSVLLRTGAVSSAPVDRKTFEGSRKVTERVRARQAGSPGDGKTVARGTKGRSPLHELFWQGEGGVNVKHGKKVPQGFVSAHTDHVHVAAGPKTVVELGKLAQRMGLRASENPAFDKVDPVHTKGSYHYRRRAVDVSGDPKKMKAFARRVTRSYGIKP